MGVTQLWQILSPVQEHQSLASLEGLVLAVDLSIWICESDGVKNMQGVVSKPHLRNLFFRVLHLTQIGVKLVFVIEGTAPELKWEVMAKRQQSRFPGRQNKQTATQKPPSKQSRRNFNAVLKECCELLDILGIPYIQSKGEAEAMCALLNSSGLVDGCLTDDGDAFLYGAQTVYRNFTMNTKDPHVERYRYADIESQLGIDRNCLVALALLLGCDFIPKGVSGIGMANALKLLECLKGRNVLERLQEWRRIHESQCLDPVEKMVRGKALNAPDFPRVDVISEFLQPKDRCPSKLLPWKRPVPVKLQDFALSKLEWPVEYTMEKILPLVTLWDMQDLLQSKNPSNHQHLRPHRIVKTRVRQGVPCYEIEWLKPVTDPYSEGEYYVTIETQDLFSKCYPRVVHAFQKEMASNNKKKKGKKKKGKEKPTEVYERSIENLSFDFGKLNIKSITRKLQRSVNELRPSFAEYEGSVLTTKIKQSSVSQTSNKVSGVIQSSENTFNLCVSKDEKQTIALDISDTSVTDELDIPFSDRVKLRLEKKRKEHQKQDTTAIKSISKEFENLSVHGSHPSQSRKKNTDNSEKKSGKIIENLDQSVNSSVFNNDSVNSPWSPFVRSSVPPNSSVGDTRKMSSPASNMFCSPATYIKQSIENDCDRQFRDSPIQNNMANTEPIQQRTTQTNFRFCETPDKVKIPMVYDSTSPLTLSQNKCGIDKNTAAKQSLLKGKWQTEFIENYIHELSKEFSLGAHLSLRHNQHGEKGSCGTFLHSQSSDTNYQKVSKDNTPNVPRKKTHVQQSNETQEINFDLQSSLLNSLCASLIQTLTPKGMNREQYESLCESLRKIEMDQGSALKNCDSGNDQSNLNFAEELALEASQHLLSESKTKPGNMNGSLNQPKYREGYSGLGKSARKRQKKKERKNINNFGAYQNNEKAFQTNEASKRTLGQNTCTSFHGNGKLAQHRVTVPDVDSYTTSEAKQLNLGQKVGPDDDNDSETSGKKKKKKKKRIKKAASTIDISKDNSVVNESQYKTCSEYLQTALAEMSRPSYKTRKLEKASPLIDLSADDTFLELDVLSSCLSGDTGSSNTDAKQKLALKKKLIKKHTQCNDTHTAVAASNDGECPGLSHRGPVLSMNTAVLSPSKAIGKMEKKIHITENERTNTHGVAKAIKPSQEIYHGQCLVSDLKHDQGVEIVSSEAAVFEDNTQEQCPSKSKEIDDLSVAERNRENALIEIKKYCNAYCHQYRSRFADLEEELDHSDQAVLVSSSGKIKDCVECCNRKFSSQYDESRDCVKEESRYTAATRESLPQELHRTKKIHDRVKEESLSKAMTKEILHKTRKIDVCCGLNMDYLSNNNTMSDVYERNIQSCQGLGSWTQVPPKSGWDQKLRCANKNIKLNYGYGLRNMQQKDNCKGCRSRSAYKPFPTDLCLHSSINHNQICWQATDEINRKIRQKQNRNSPGERYSAMSDLNTADSEIGCHIDGEPDMDLSDKFLKTCLNDIQDDKISELYTKEKSVDYSENNNWTNVINTDNDKYLYTAFKTETSTENRHTGKSSCKIDGGKLHQEQSKNRTSFGPISDFKPKEYGNNLPSSDGELEDTDNTGLTPNSTSHVDFVLQTKPMRSVFRSNIDTCSDVSLVNIKHDAKEETEVNGLSENSGDSTVDDILEELEDEDSLESCEAEINKVDDKTESCMHDGNDTLHINSDRSRNTYSHAIERNLDTSDDEGTGELSGLDIINIPERNGLDCKVKEKLENDSGGSSDKENEKIVQNGESLKSAIETSEDNISGGRSKEESSDYLPSSAKVEARDDVQRGASPIPLLDRLKMKFKKASARSVLHSFTNGR